VCCCSSSKNIIDDDHLSLGDERSVFFSYSKGITKIGESLFSVQLGLGVSWTGPFDGFNCFVAAESGKFSAQLIGLVALSPLFPSPEKRNRDQNRTFEFGKPRIFLKGFFKKKLIRVREKIGVDT
jgi:hypothetical protein